VWRRRLGGAKVRTAEGGGSTFFIPYLMRIIIPVLEVTHGRLYLREMRQPGGHPLQTQEMPSLQWNRHHVQNGSSGRQERKKEEAIADKPPPSLSFAGGRKRIKPV
jgi:hypothetical protein